MAGATARMPSSLRVSCGMPFWYPGARAVAEAFLRERTWIEMLDGAAHATGVLPKPKPGRSSGG